MGANGVALRIQSHGNGGGSFAVGGGSHCGDGQSHEFIRSGSRLRDGDSGLGLTGLVGGGGTGGTVSPSLFDVLYG